MLLLFFCAAAFPAKSPAEVWEGRCLLARAVAEVERDGANIRGVVFLKEPFREVSTYHFSGEITGDEVFASHYTGHRFRGRLIGDGRISGVLTTKTGERLTIDIIRRR